VARPVLGLSGARRSDFRRSATEKEEVTFGPFLRLPGCVWGGLQAVSDDEVRGGLSWVLRWSGGRRPGFEPAAMGSCVSPGVAGRR
jgi:hypothetical protein